MLRRARPSAALTLAPPPTPPTHIPEASPLVSAAVLSHLSPADLLTLSTPRNPSFSSTAELLLLPNTTHLRALALAAQGQSSGVLSSKKNSLTPPAPRANLRVSPELPAGPTPLSYFMTTSPPPPSRSPPMAPQHPPGQNLGSWPSMRGPVGASPTLLSHCTRSSNSPCSPHCT